MPNREASPKTETERVASLAWIRWPAVVLALVAIAMARSFWDDRARPGALFWFALSGGLGYAAIALLLNRTHLRVRDGFLLVSHRPIPFPGKRVPISRIRAVEVEPRRTTRNADEAVHFELWALLEGGEKVRLTWGPMASHRRERLEEVARTLAARLGIPTRA